MTGPAPPRTLAIVSRVTVPASSAQATPVSSHPQPGNVRALLELYGVTGPERDGLIQLSRDARKPGWWHSFRDVLTDPYEVYAGFEAGAASIRGRTSPPA